MKKPFYIIITVVVVALAVFGYFLWQGSSSQVFLVPPNNTSSKSDLIQVDTPFGGQSIGSPVKISGKARGSWYFEASFPIRLVDGEGNTIATAIAQAQGNWMTSDFVPFSANLTFGVPQTKTGTLVLLKDNPSGRPESADELRAPIVFANPDFGTTTATSTL